MEYEYSRSVIYKWNATNEHFTADDASPQVNFVIRDFSEKYSEPVCVVSFIEVSSLDGVNLFWFFCRAQGESF